MITPGQSLGETTSAADVAAFRKAFAAEIGRVAGATVVDTDEVDRRLAGRARFAACGDRAECLRELARGLGASVTVTFELGALGPQRVVYVRRIDRVSTGIPAISLTREIAPEETLADVGRELAVRLFAPEAYAGEVVLRGEIRGYEVSIDGQVVSPIIDKGTARIEASVGAHALRVSHPDYRDLTRFIEVRYRQPTEVALTMVARPQARISMKEVPERDSGPRLPRRWIVGAVIGSAVVVAGFLAGRWMAPGVQVDRDIGLP